MPDRQADKKGLKLGTYKTVRTAHIRNTDGSKEDPSRSNVNDKAKQYLSNRLIPGYFFL